ncbi:MAG: hypothetical protein D6710_00660 [Nitrospirae bacterium]|nr:MAG: hypothetical protein D6710_00660 [Nitrospirota bacterium]
MVEIDEPVGVVATFYQGRIRPLKFRWGDRVIPVKSVTYQWIRQDGFKRLYFFSVTDGKTLYNLSYDGDTLTWRLEAVETERG